MTLYGIDLMDITFNISSNYLLLLNSLRLFCITLVLMLLFLGLVFDEKNCNYWTTFLWVLSFLIGLELGTFLFT